MINNIYCIGRNYAEHAKELGNRVEAEPVVFSKPNSSLIHGSQMTLPAFSQDIHFETELVLRICRDGFQISEVEADSYFDEVAVGLDLTARDIQTDLKEKKLPWLLCKGFKDSCYISSFVKKDRLDKDISFHMLLNGTQRQSGNSRDMIFGFNAIISFVSKYIPLVENDVIFTGTPKGVGQLHAKDVITLFLEDQEIGNLTVK